MNSLEDRPRTQAEAAANRAFWRSVLLGMTATLALPVLHGIASLLPASVRAQEFWERTQIKITGVRQQVELQENENDRLKKEIADTTQKAKSLESQAALAEQDAKKLAQEASLSAEQAAEAEARQSERLDAVIQALDARILSGIRQNP